VRVADKEGEVELAEQLRRNNGWVARLSCRVVGKGRLSLHTIRDMALGLGSDASLRG